MLLKNNKKQKPVVEVKSVEIRKQKTSTTLEVPKNKFTSSKKYY